MSFGLLQLRLLCRCWCCLLVLVMVCGVQACLLLADALWLQVSDVAMHFVKQNIFVNSGRSDQMKVVQGDPGALLRRSACSPRFFDAFCRSRFEV